ncbi:MAG: Hsp70 family protein [Desulfobacterales bacterium]|nr:Hsp70 family protein [Desulfobacterales bacterium]
MSEIAIGIDLGTTNCSVAYINNSGKPEVIKNEYGENITPSVVLFKSADEIIIGIEAKQLTAFEKNIASFFKRDMGTDAAYLYHDKHYSPIEISAELLKKLKKDSENALGIAINKAVITVPAYFQDKERVNTKKAAELAGLEVLNIINEPTSAALAYGVDKSGQDENVLVYDLGGGTFDVSLVKIASGSVKVIGTDGNHNLGGKDWDDRLVNFICKNFENKHGIDPLDDVDKFREILVNVEKAKKALTSLEKTFIIINYDGINEKVEITRHMFEDLTKDLLSQTETLMEKVLDETGYSFDQISSVLMVGGSTRMPMCKKLAKKVSGKEPNCSINPDECVALGAAIQANRQLQQRGIIQKSSIGLMKLQDVTAHSLGLVIISADGKKYENAIILPKNRQIPAVDSQIKVLRTSSRKENQLEIFLLQGESKRPLDNTLLGKYTFNGVPHYKGETRIKIEYKYDSNTIVKVEAYDEKSGIKLPGPLIDNTNMDLSWTDYEPELVKDMEEIYVMLCIDVSGSMSGGNLQQAKSGALNFMKNLDIEYTSTGLISFGSSAQLLMHFTKSAKDMNNAINSLSISGSTNMTDALRIAYSNLICQEGRRVIVLLTDGGPNDRSSTLEEGQSCRDENIEIITIGTDGADQSFLKALATSDESQFFAAPKDLGSTFSKIARDLSEHKSALRLNK